MATILVCTPALSLPSFYSECTISTPCDSNPSYGAHCHPVHFLQRNNFMLLSASCTAIIFFLPHTLRFPKKETLFTTSALGSYQPSFLLPFRKISKDTCIHVSRITSVHSLLVLFSPTGHLMISFTPSGFEELLALRFISVPEITSDGKCPVAGLKQIAI